MSSGVEIEDGRVPVLFEKAPELLILGSEGSVPAGQRGVGLGSGSRSPDWDADDGPVEVLGDSACNSAHIASLEVAGPVAGDFVVNCDGLGIGTAQNPSNTNWFPGENEREEPVFEREASQTCGAEVKDSNAVAFACFDSLKELPLSMDLFEQCDVGASEHLSPSAERLRMSLESGDASGNSIRWSGPSSHGHEIHRNEEGKASLSCTEAIILGSENEQKVSEYFVASEQFNTLDNLLLNSSSSQEFFSEFDQIHEVSTLKIGSKPSIIGFKEREAVDHSRSLLLPNEKQKGAFLEAEEAQTWGIEKKPSNLTSNTDMSMAMRSLEPVLSTTHPTDSGAKHFSLLASEHDGCISPKLAAHANSLDIGCEGMHNLQKEPTDVDSQSCLLQRAERKEVVGEFSAAEDSKFFQSDDQKAPIVEDERLQALVDTDVEPQTDNNDKMDHAGKSCHLIVSAPPEICVLNGQDAHAHELLAEEAPMKDSEGDPCNFTSCVVSYNSRSASASPESVSPRNFSPCERKGAGTEFSTIGVERFEMSKMEEQKCSFDFTFSYVVEASAASFESSQVADDVLLPFSSSSIELTALVCDDSGSIPRIEDNGTKSLTVRSDRKSSLEPVEGALCIGLAHEDNEEVTVLKSESLEGATFQKICEETIPEATNVTSPSFNNNKLVVEAFRNNTNSPMAEIDQVGSVTEFLVLEGKRTRISSTENGFYCSEGVSSCSIQEDPIDSLSVGSTHPRRSPRLTRMRNAARQCWKTLEAIAVSLEKSRKKRSSFCKRARTSTWGALQNIAEVFSQEGKIIESNFGKVPKNRLRKGRGGLGERRRQKKTRTKGCSHVSKKKQRNSTKKIHLKLKIDEKLVLPTIPGQVDLPTSSHTVPNDGSPELESFTGLKLDNNFGTSIGCNTEKPLGELSRDKDLESTVTQETSLENYFGEFHGVSSQRETQTSAEAFYNKDVDASTSPDSNVFQQTPGLTETKSAVCSMSEIANQSDSALWSSPDLDVPHSVQVPDVVERENGGDEGESQEISGDRTLIDSQAVVPHEAALPSNVQQNRKKRESPNKKINNVQCLPSVEDGLIGSETIRMGRIQSRYRRQRKAEGKLENRKQEISMHSLEGRSSNCGVLKLESPINKMAELEMCHEVSIVEEGPDFQGIPVQDDHVKALKASRDITRSSDLISTVGKNTGRQKKGSREKATKRKWKKDIAGQNVLEEDVTSDLSNSTGYKRDGEGIGNEVIYDSIFSSKMLPLGGGQELEIQPRAAWVRCDDCYKWRCISAELADEIEETNCRWTCKENADKHFADCSIPQEKSNAEINAELEISDASGDEDSRCQQPSYKRSESRQLTVAQQAPWTLVKHNIFLHRSPKTQTIDEVMVCHCKPPSDGSLGCGDECLNRMLNIECVQGTCPCGDLCSNQQFQKRKYAKLMWFRSGKKGYGLQLLDDVPCGNFLIEYVGEVLDLHTYETRQRDYASRGQKHFYFMTLNGSEVIDACAKGNLGRFINHSCEPNCRTEKWMVNGEVCIGLFALRDIKKGEEVTFDYNYVRVFGAAAKKCHCGSSECQGYIGGDPSNTEAIVHVDSDDEYPEPVMLFEDAADGFNLSETDPPKDDSGDKLLSTISCGASSNMQKLDKPWQKTDNVNGLHSDIQQPRVSLSLRGKDSFNPLSGEKSKIPLMEESMGRLSLPSEELDSLSSPTASPQLHLPKEKVMDEICGASEPPGTVLLKSMDRSSTVEIYEPIKYTIEDKPETVKMTSYVKSSRSSSIKKGKISAAKLLSCKTKRPLEASSSGRFEGVEEKLTELVDAHGGISKRKDATKGYLKLLFVTAASGDNIKGETSQSTRDLSIVLDALLKTKSRSVLVDIVNKNGLQMLHNIMKQNRRNFHKIPIIRKLLKVIEYLGVKEILTFEHVNIPPPCAGMESFRESIIILTRHNDIQVHQMARNFRDRWFPRNIRKVYTDRDESKLDNHNHFHLSQKRWHDQGARPSDAIECIGQTNPGLAAISTSEPEHSSGALDAGVPVTVSKSSDGTKRTRKRKSRWDQPEETSPAQPPEPVDAQVVDPSLHREREINLKQPAVCDGVDNQVPSVEADATFHHVGDGPDVPPGFSSSVSDSSNMSSTSCPSTALGQPQARYLGHLPVSYGIPWTQVQEFGIAKTEGPDQWEVAPGVPFRPFPPLPPYPREATGFGEVQGPQGFCLMASPDVLHCGANEIDGNERVRWSSGDGLGRRYFKQQKWNNNWGNRPRWVKRRAWGFKGNNNGNHSRSCLNSVVCVEDVRDECGGISSKESVNENSGGSGGPPCFTEAQDETSSCRVDSGNNAALCPRSEVHCHQ